MPRNRYVYVESVQQHGVCVQEVDGEDPGGLGVQELPPGRARAARRRIDARGVQDLPHGGRCDRNAEFRQFAVDPAVSPHRVLLRQPNDKAGDARDRRRAAGLAAIAHVVPVGGQPAVPGQECRWRDGEDFGPAPAGYEPCQRCEPYPVSRSYRIRPACLRSTAFSCRSTSSSASFDWSPRNARAVRPSIRRASR